MNDSLRFALKSVECRGAGQWWAMIGARLQRAFMLNMRPNWAKAALGPLSLWFVEPVFKVKLLFLTTIFCFWNCIGGYGFCIHWNAVGFHSWPESMPNRALNIANWKLFYWFLKKKKISRKRKVCMRKVYPGSLMCRAVCQLSLIKWDQPRSWWHDYKAQQCQSVFLFSRVDLVSLLSKLEWKCTFIDHFMSAAQSIMKEKPIVEEGKSSTWGWKT